MLQRLTLAWLFVVALITQATEMTPEKELAKTILQDAGIKSGQALCAHLNCGEGKLTLELVREGKFLVQGLVSDNEIVQKARKTLQTAKVYGQATVNFCDFKELPYTENIVNFIIAENLPALIKNGLTLKEIFRVVCPLGVVYLNLNDGITEEKLKKELQEVGVAQYECAEQAY